MLRPGWNPPRQTLRSYRDALLSRLLSSRAARRRYQGSAAGPTTRGMLARVRFSSSQRRSPATARSSHPPAHVWLLSNCHEASGISPGFAPPVSSQIRLHPRAASGVRLGSAHCRALETRLAAILLQRAFAAATAAGKPQCLRHHIWLTRKRQNRRLGALDSVTGKEYSASGMLKFSGFLPTQLFFTLRAGRSAPPKAQA